MTINTKNPEILSPAGNLEKLKFAVRFGADAVYCSLDKFGMRAAADNFTPSELEEGIKFAKQYGCKVYVTVNTMPHEHEFTLLDEYLEILKNLSPDAYIVADPGVLTLIHHKIPQAVIHLSTQVSTVNAAACRFWYNQGVKRIVLARELNIKNIINIKKNIPDDLELEVFVHGSMCMAYSGRCLLSNYYVNRDANRGGCAQPCRWKYYISEEKRPDNVITAEQYDEGTYLFSSKDLCMIGHLKDLIDAGINSFKIEGRIKSAYYTACVTNAYRMALDDVMDGKPFNSLLLREVMGVSRREYSTGYFYTSPYDSANIVGTNEYICEKAFLATVVSVNENGFALCKQRNKMTVGQSAEALSPGTTGRKIEIAMLFDEEMNPIGSTPHPGMMFYINAGDLEAGDIIRGI